jgi:ankyrin repeat protein
MERYVLGVTLTIHIITLQGMKLSYQEQGNLDVELRTAAMYGDLEMINSLIKAGANICDINQGDYTALMFAAWQGHSSICKLLVEKILAPSAPQKKEICIFLGYLKKSRTKGDYHNLQNIFKEAFCKFCKERNAPNAYAEINKICYKEIKQDLLQILP